MDLALQRLRPGGVVAGTAVTLSIPSQDSTLLHHVIGMLRPGDFLVVERQGDHRHACWGGGVTRAARNAGLAGAVIDGPCTDPGEIASIGFPLWCRGVSAITTRMNDVGGRFNMPVSCGGVAVSPGDLVLADESGVLVLPRDEASAVAQRALALAADIERGEQRLDAGELLGKVYGASALVVARR
ncbi:RraA family protein [Massilia cavernae]|uniref:Putative 4-hydroxy-4-methyl-2-oxoglutarate aldolase n=1 Tax=Massilia cavernae TaxID=2320864 RepID=A0A418XQW7_9BURK|nr:RraA family protein [Massilia cavernae]RJG14870.1 RraA family protein [Massilia cavernae]